jgi:hypothetical protein
VFTLVQAKAVNDTFVYQRAEIERLKNIKPIVRVDTVEIIKIIQTEQKDQLFTIEGLVFMVVQGIIMFPLIFMK